MNAPLRSLLIALALFSTPAPTLRAADLAIVNARVFVSPDDPPLDRGTVVVRDGRIAAVGADVPVPVGATVIDGAGFTLTAGFWNSHVHLLPEGFTVATHPPADLERQLRDLFGRWGFTTVFDLASPLDNALALRQRVESGEIRGPRVLTAGNPFFPAGGTPIYVLETYRARGWNDEVSTPAEARARAVDQLARGADGVKVFTGAIVGPPQGVLPMRPDVASAAVAPALAAGKPAFAHPTDPRGIRLALDAGVTVLAHTTPTEGPWPDELVRELARRRVALVPTLMLLEVALKEDGVPVAIRDRMMADAQQQVRALAAAGGDILFGTDVGFIAEADTTLEYRLMAGAGLDHRAILRSLTTTPAARFGGAARSGRLVVGDRADLVLLGADPSRDIDAFADVRCTIRDGRVIYAAASTAAVSAPANCDGRVQ
jgi:imidazolonepropionase-like amidohydrolase